MPPIPTVQPKSRHTDRVTRSTSVTSGGGIPQLAQEIPEDLIFQAVVDLGLDALWQARPKIREHLQRLVNVARGGVITEDELRKLFNIVHYNDGYRRRSSFDPAIWAEPAPDTSVRTPPPEPPEEEEAHKVGAPPVHGAEPEPEAEVEDDADGVAVDKGYFETDVALFDPPLPAAHIARGWGFRNGGVVDSFRREFSDFPAPIPASEIKVRLPLWWWSDIAWWSWKHRAVLRLRRSRATRMTAARTESRQRTDTQAELAALRAEIAALRAAANGNGGAP